MSFDFKIDLSDFEKAAMELGGELDQVRFAAANAMNDAVEHARSILINDTWPDHINERNHSFLNASLTTRGSRATKKSLSVTLYDKLGHGNLAEHAEGGIRTPRGKSLAVPASKHIVRGQHGVSKGQKPRSLPNTFIKDGVIYQKRGSYVKSGSRKVKGQDNRRLELMYVLKPQTTIKKDVPFYEVFEQVVTDSIGRSFAARLEKAMKTRR